MPSALLTRVAVAIAAAFAATPACLCEAIASDHATRYLLKQRLLFEADLMANESVTHEICGWGFIDLRTLFLSSVMDRGMDIPTVNELAIRFDDAVRQRRQAEAMLTTHGENAPMQRTSGLYATGGCTDAVRERIEASADQITARHAVNP